MLVPDYPIAFCPDCKKNTLWVSALCSFSTAAGFLSLLPGMSRACRASRYTARPHSCCSGGWQRVIYYQRPLIGPYRLWLQAGGICPTSNSVSFISWRVCLVGVTPISVEPLPMQLFTEIDTKRRRRTTTHYPLLILIFAIHSQVLLHWEVWFFVCGDTSILSRDVIMKSRVFQF